MWKMGSLEKLDSCDRIRIWSYNEEIDGEEEEEYHSCDRIKGTRLMGYRAIN